MYINLYEKISNCIVVTSNDHSQTMVATQWKDFRSKSWFIIQLVFQGISSNTSLALFLCPNLAPRSNYCLPQSFSSKHLVCTARLRVHINQRYPLLHATWVIFSHQLCVQTYLNSVFSLSVFTWYSNQREDRQVLL